MADRQHDAGSKIEGAEMTDDLVKRLLDIAGDTNEENETLHEAADHIEKLEAVLRDLSDGWKCCPVSQAMRRVARNALESDNG